MQTIKELAESLGLNQKQTNILETYVATLIIELLENLKIDNLKNFDETISSLSAPEESGK